jgi:hypothetical protein
LRGGQKEDKCKSGVKDQGQPEFGNWTDEILFKMPLIACKKPPKAGHFTPAFVYFFITKFF